MISSLIVEKENAIKIQREILKSLRGAIEVKHDTIVLVIGTSERKEEYPLMKELRALELQEADAEKF